MKIANGCAYCPSTLPIVVMSSRIGAEVAICRACVLEALAALEQPDEYPAVIEKRDNDIHNLQHLRETS